MNNNTQLREALNGFITSYSERDQRVDFSDWLGDTLRQAIPDLSPETSKKLTEEIIGGVSEYNKTLGELNAAIESGQAKDEWLSEKLEETYQGMPQDEVGEKLSQFEEACTVSNAMLLTDNENAQIETTAIVDDAEVNWNEYSLRDKTYNIGKQIALSGTAIAANALKNSVESGESLNIADAVRETMQNGLINNSDEVKAVVAGAVKSVAQKGLEKVLPSDTPTEHICDMAGAAVEGAEALFDAARGEISATEAMDKTGRAVVAAGCRIGAGMLKGKIMSIPVVGPLVAELAGGLLDHMESPQFFNNVYTVVRDAAKATWEGVKQFGRNLLNKIKIFG